MTANVPDGVNYDEFRKEWLAEIEGTVSSLDKGRRFAIKLITQWLEVDPGDEDFVVYDGSGDGGIDIAYLQRTSSALKSQDNNVIEGDIWYLIQSKYGTGFTGSGTILEEGSKIIATLRGQNNNLSDDSRRLLRKLDSFRSQASQADRIVLVFATTDPIDQRDRQTLENIKLIGREHVIHNFDVEEVSVFTIWERQKSVEPSTLSVPVNGQFVEHFGLLVGTVSLTDLFEFLKSYKSRSGAGDLDQLYEKNVRKFLGGRRKVNRGIADTLNKNPEKFGLYNNGITIVVSGYSKSPNDDTVTLNDPYVVNGCQTTRTIWQVLDDKLNAGGTGHDTAIEVWREQASRGGVVTKIVRSDKAEITNITRFTNSQNSVREQDFIALNSGFQNWAADMVSHYHIFLEIQRGGIESRKAWEKQHPPQELFNDYVNAFDLIKVYGAGWLEEPGSAFGKNAPFLPNGPIYERMVSRQEGEPPFGASDLYAAYKVKCAADQIGFGRSADRPSRRQSRFLFYHIVLKMLGNVILLTPQLNCPKVIPSILTKMVIRLAGCPSANNGFDMLCKAATELLDQYLTAGTDSSAHKERAFVENYNGDMNAFLKAENLGKEKHSPLLLKSLAIQNAAFSMSGGRERVAEALLPKP